jgi:hypothetical protein
VFTQDVGAAVFSDEFLDFVEGGEEGDDACFVGVLGAGETGFVDAAVDVGLEPGGDFVDLLAEGRGVEVDFLDVVVE